MLLRSTGSLVTYLDEKASVEWILKASGYNAVKDMLQCELKLSPAVYLEK